MQRQPLLRFFSRYAPLVAWLALISIASSDGFSSANTSRIVGPVVHWFFPNITPERLELVHLLIRKLGHLSEYALLGLLATRAFSTSPNRWLRKHWFGVALGLVVVYALLDEYHQSFVPSRTSSISDSFIDMIGGLVAIILVRWHASPNRSSN